jgi:membrane-bound lytic murein transglycosylase B
LQLPPIFLSAFHHLHFFYPYNNGNTIQTELIIDDVNNQISATQKKIQENKQHTITLKQQISGVIQDLYEADSDSTIEILLLSPKLSDFFDKIEQQKQVSKSLEAVLERTKEANALLEQQEKLLTSQKDEQEKLVGIINIQSQSILSNISEQNSVLTTTKGKESNFKAILADTRQRAAQIRSRIYELLGLGTQVTFGQALEVANMASSLTGVRSAFLLAILTQESNLGKNVGTCNRLGDPPEKSWKVVMKPDRDQEPFLQITKELALDPDTTPVSCPMRGKDGTQIGWGGAMGPAQFIPSTWLGYKDKVTAITGKTANPWDIRDAFLAAGIKLKAGGADSKDGEWAAAMRYFSGGTIPKFRFYGDNVLVLAEKYQADIDTLANK